VAFNTEMAEYNISDIFTHQFWHSYQK